MKVTYKLVTKIQIDILVKLRLKVLKEVNCLDQGTDMSMLEQESYRYFQRGFQGDTFRMYFAYNNEKIVGCGGVSFYEVMPTCDNSNGKCAYIMNMYTEKSYRNLGIATGILDLIIQDVNIKKINRITLEATEMGKMVYEKYGFIDMQNEMIYKGNNML